MTNILYFNFRITLLILIFCNDLKVKGSLKGFANESKLFNRERRNLLYPYITILQVNIGLSTPTSIKQVQVNWAAQANFELPWNISQTPSNILHATNNYNEEFRQYKENNNKIYERKYDYDNSVQLNVFYKYIEDILNGYGYNGAMCVRRTLCELGAEPLYPRDEDDLLHEIIVFILK